MKKKVLSVLLVAVCVLSMAACGSKKEDSSAGDAGDSGKKEKLVMATNAEFPPYEFYEGKEVVGIDADIAAAVAEEMGMELEIEVPEENAPNNAQRLSRKNFYLRNGLKETGLAHINPDGVKLALLAFDEPITHDEYMDTMRKSYGKRLAAKFIEIK